MKLILSIIFCLFSFLSFGQANESNQRFIEVTGEGEIKIDPNIIYLSIGLKEHKKDGKIIRIEELEGKLLEILKSLEIPNQNLKVYASSGRQLDLKKRKTDLLISKHYSLKLEEIGLLNPVLTSLGEENIFMVNVREVTHSEIDKFKNEAKVKAITNAKDKATLLVTTLNTKLGQVLTIRETETVEAYPLQGRVAGIMVRGTSSLQEAQNNAVEFEQIKINYKIITKFKID